MDSSLRDSYQSDTQGLVLKSVQVNEVLTSVIIRECVRNKDSPSSSSSYRYRLLLIPLSWSILSEESRERNSWGTEKSKSLKQKKRKTRRQFKLIVNISFKSIGTPSRFPSLCLCTTPRWISKGAMWSECQLSALIEEVQQAGNKNRGQCSNTFGRDWNIDVLNEEISYMETQLVWEQRITYYRYYCVKKTCTKCRIRKRKSFPLYSAPHLYVIIQPIVL